MACKGEVTFPVPLCFTRAPQSSPMQKFYKGLDADHHKLQLLSDFIIKQKVKNVI